LILIALALVAIQTIVSKKGRNYFKYGPLEWLWRCGTYLKIQPLIKETKAITRPVKVTVPSK
jgi:uncharacterized protein